MQEETRGISERNCLINLKSGRESESCSRSDRMQSSNISLKQDSRRIVPLDGASEEMVVVETSERGILDHIEAAESEPELDLENQAYLKAALVIQRQARVMIARNNFRVALYKLILLKNIVETKMHKERMQMLYAFEQLIINTEEGNDSEDPHSGMEDDERTNFIEQTGLTREQIEEVLANETDPYLR